MSKSFCVHVLFAAVISALVSVALTLLLSVGVLFLDLSEGMITALNQLTKVFSVLLSVLILRKKEEGRELAFGVSVGLVYILLGLGIFCAFEGRLLPLFTVGAELALGLVSGFLSGLCARHIPEKAVKTRKRRRN